MMLHLENLSVITASEGFECSSDRRKRVTPKLATCTHCPYNILRNRLMGCENCDLGYPGCSGRSSWCGGKCSEKDWVANIVMRKDNHQCQYVVCAGKSWVELQSLPWHCCFPCQSVCVHQLSHSAPTVPYQTSCFIIVFHLCTSEKNTIMVTFSCSWLLWKLDGGAVQLKIGQYILTWLFSILRTTARRDRVHCDFFTDDPWQ